MVIRRGATSARRGIIRTSVLAVVLVLSSAGSAEAHGGTADATNYSSRFADTGPRGLDWIVRGGDSLLELTNRTGEVVVVRGYQGEPYLEFRADSTVWVNTRSPARYQNTTRYATEPLPAEADATAEPEWVRVASDATYSWHDHRIHWMSPLLPEGVDADPSLDQRILDWTIPLTIGGVDAVATGELWWIAPSPWWPPVVFPAIVLFLIAMMAVVRTAPTDGGALWPGTSRPVVVMIGLVAVANVVRVVDDMSASSASLGEQVTISIGTIVSLAAVAALCRAAWRGTGGGHLALVGAGLAMMLIFGGEATDMLTASQITTELPMWVRRWTVGVSYAVIVPTTVVAVAAARHFATHYRDRPVGVPRRVTAKGAESTSHNESASEMPQ